MTSSLVLGMSWLTKYDPKVYWSDYHVAMPCGAKTVIIDRIERLWQTAQVTLFSAKAAYKAIQNGAQAWFMILNTSDISTLHGVKGIQASNKVVHSQTADHVQV